MGSPHRRNLTNHFFSRLPSVGTDGNHAGTPTPTRSFERTCWRWQGQPETTYHTRRRGCLVPTAPASAHSSERPTPTNTNERDSSTRRHHAAVPASRLAANHPGASDDTSELHGCSLGWKEPPPVHVRLSPRPTPSHTPNSNLVYSAPRPAPHTRHTHPVLVGFFRQRSAETCLV
jgi:hypothetical protein